MIDALLRRFAIVALLLALSGCEYHGLTCWNRLENLYNELTWLLDGPANTDPANVADVRSRIASNVEQCRGGDFYRDFDDSDIAPEGFNITLFDLSIMANDPQLAAEMYERHLELSPEIREEILASGNEHLGIAAFVESDKVVRWMLENRFDANRVSESGGTPLIFAGTRTDAGLQVTRDLVANGASLSYETAHGVTPLIAAWRQGNLAKVQCLVSLGATIPNPLPVEEEPLSPFVDPYDVEQVTAFLSDAERQIPANIAKICSIVR